MAKTPETEPDQSTTDSYRWLEVERCRYMAAVLQRIGLEMQDLATEIEHAGPRELASSIGPVSDIVLACATNLEQCLVQVREQSGLPPKRNRRGDDWGAGPY